MMTSDWNRHARAEFDEAADYYERQSVGLGDRFIGQIEATVARALLNPLMPRCSYRECRKLKADKFPYVVIYRIKESRLEILSVMHTSRHPDYWKSRIKP
jgi:toxin ParE1/3/4